MNRQAQSQLLEVIEAKERGEWDRALALLRRWAKYVDPAVASRIRGGIWQQAGDIVTAVVFLEHAARLQPRDARYAVVYLLTLEQADQESARRVAETWVGEGKKHPAVALVAAGSVLLRTATPATAVRLHTVVEQAAEQLAGADEDSEDAGVYPATFGILAALEIVAGRTHDAFRTLERGLALYPNNPLLLLHRGAARGLTGPVGVEYLNRAAVFAPRMFWIDYLLARHYLSDGDDNRCRQHCERALSKEGPAAAPAEVAQWLGMSQLLSGYPVVAVQEAFELARALAPQDSQVVENFARFRRYLDTVQAPHWVMRTQAEVCSDFLHSPPTLLAA